MHGSKEAGRSHWLIAKHGVSGLDVLTVDLGGSAEALAVFSVEEETREFLDFRPEASGEGWKARQTWPGELASVLYGPCSAVKKVALDPLPEAVDKGKLVGLQAMDRNDFLRKLLGEGPQGIRPVSSRTPGSYKGLPLSRVA
jgi:hypothetical protein